MVSYYFFQGGGVVVNVASFQSRRLSIECITGDAF